MRTLGLLAVGSTTRLDVNRWLISFATVFAIFSVTVLILILVITPIVPLPAFIDFPVATQGSKSPDREEDIALTIRATGQMFFQSELVSEKELRERLRAAYGTRDPVPTVRLRVDRTARYRDVRQVIVAARDAGFSRVTIMVRHVDEGETIQQ